MLGYQDLTPRHGRWIKDCWDDQTRETNFMAFRGSFKTTARGVVGTIYNQLQRPNETVIIARKTDTGAAEVVGEIVKHYQGPVMRWIYDSFWGVKQPLARFNAHGFDLTKKRKTRVTKEMSVQAVGVGGSITGTHADIILADDIVTDRDRYYERERERTINFARELYNVVNRNGRLRWQGTAWHRKDALHVVAPMPQPGSYWPIGSFDIAGVNPAFIDQLRKETTPGLFAANYMLELVEDVSPEFGAPIPGDLTPEEWKQVKIVAAVDPAFDGEDFTAVSIGGMFKGRFYLKRGHIWRKNIADLYDTLERIFRENEVGKVICETNGAQVLAAREFARRGFLVHELKSTANKYARITDSLKKAWQRLCFGIHVSGDYLSQVCEYNENADHDDAPDSLHMLLDVLNPSETVQVGKVRNM